MKLLIKLVLLIICMASLIRPSFADFQKGARAYALKDYQTAFKEFTLAVKNNPSDTKGMNNLGVIYYYGLGRTKDYRKAYEWYKKAGDLGNPTAQASLGVMFEDGIGVPQDYNMAILWYQKAADQNFKGAKRWLRRVKRIANLESNVKECKPWIELANPFQQAQMHLFASQLPISLLEKARILTLLGTLPWSEDVETFKIGIPLQVEIGKDSRSNSHGKILNGFLMTLKGVSHCE